MQFLTADPATPVPDSPEYHQVAEADVRKVLSSVNPNKAKGPDNISTRVLKICACDLAPVFSHIFNQSLRECKVPELWKTSTIIPVPKKSSASEPNDFRPVALTPPVMKCLERLVLRHLLQQCQDQLDQYQFAYKKKRGVEDASTLLMHAISEHLEKPGCFAKVLFIDFSSAFNTMRPSILLNKLETFGIDPTLRLWILDYLRRRPQRVKVNGSLSSVHLTNIGAPQGCVLSPVLFTIYTNDHQSSDTVTKVIKY
jgi:hypothetical protein